VGATRNEILAMLKRVAAVAIALNAIARLPGFLSAWRLAEWQDVPWTAVVLKKARQTPTALPRAIGANRDSWWPSEAIGSGIWGHSAGALSEDT
jgi:hypothetical protein